MTHNDEKEPEFGPITAEEEGRFAARDGEAKRIIRAFTAPLRALLPPEDAEELSSFVDDFATLHPTMTKLLDELTPRAAPEASGAVEKAPSRKAKKASGDAS